MKITPVRSSKILIGREAIRHYIARHDGSPVTWKVVKGHIALGMPAVFINGGWVAYADHVDEYFKNLTFTDARKDVDEVEDDDD